MLDAPENALSVPTSALLPFGNEQVVFVGQPDASGSLKIHAVPVSLLGSDNNVSVVVNTSDRHTAILTKGALAVIKGTSVLKSMIPVQ